MVLTIALHKPAQLFFACKPFKFVNSVIVKAKHGRGDILGGLHIQFRRIQIFLFFYFYSFNIAFKDKPSAVLTS